MNWLHKNLVQPVSFNCFSGFIAFIWVQFLLIYTFIMCGQMITFHFFLLDVGSSMQLKDERTTSEMEEKSNIPESTSTSQFRNKNKLQGGKQREPIAVSRTEGTNAKKSKLARDSTPIDINVVSELEQLHSTSKLWKRKRKSSVSKVKHRNEGWLRIELSLALSLI